MSEMFLEVLETAKNEGKLIAIRTNEDAASKFFAGYVQEYDESMAFLKSIDPEGGDDGYLYIKMESIYEIDYNNRYLKRLQFLLKNKNGLLSNKIISARGQGGNYLINLLKTVSQQKLIAGIYHVYDFTITGYLIKSDDENCSIQSLTDDGDDDGISIIRIEDIVSINIDGRDEKKIELYYKNRNSF
jgi:hypothetical protein